MSTIDPSTIDPSKPTTGNALTADVRANEQATQDQLQNAKNDIEALETAPVGHQVQAEGTTLPIQRPLLNFAGNGVSTVDNPGAGSTDVIVNNAVINSAGAGATVYQSTTGADPVTVNLRTFISGDASVSITQLADELDLRATGLGGGESNTQTNIGAGVAAGLAKNGVDLPLRTFDPGQFETNVNQIRVAAGVFDPDGSAATVQGNLTTHANNTAIHFTVASIPVATISATGFAPVLSNVATEYLDGTGAYSVPAGGSGDMLSPVAAVAVGEVYAATTTAGDQTEGSGITVQTGAPGNGTVLFDLSTPASAYALLPTGGTVDQQAFTQVAFGGVYNIAPATDVGAQLAGRGLEMNHAGAAMLGDPTGGVPATNGVLNTKGVQIDGVDIYSVGNPPPATPAISIVGQWNVGELVTAVTNSGGGAGTAETSSNLNVDDVVRKDQSGVLQAGVGLTATVETLNAASMPTYIPDLSVGQYTEFFAATPQSVIVELPTGGTGFKFIHFPANVTPALSGVWQVEVGSPGVTARDLQIVSLPGSSAAYWSNP